VQWGDAPWGGGRSRRSEELRRRRRAALDGGDGEASDGGVDESPGGERTPVQKRAKHAAASPRAAAEAWRHAALVRRLRLVGAPVFLDAVFAQIGRPGSPLAGLSLLARLLGRAAWGAWHGAVVARPTSLERVDWAVRFTSRRLRTLPLSFVVASALGATRTALLWERVLAARPAARRGGDSARSAGEFLHLPLHFMRILLTV
jgi:hypothetical protein